ncbi:MAG: oligosaccharide flippase family protein [Myxococcota bacterium]|jgi:O-antigen/teichoic acid export membrane protein|nr:oligosaccharide flippase family protein [Myxococcota bacterium]
MTIRSRVAELVGKENAEFLKHSANYLSADAVVGVIGIASLPILTHLLSKAEYGELGVFLSTASVFALFIELNFRGALNRYWLDKPADGNDFLKTNLLFLAAFSGLVLLLCWWARAPLARFFAISSSLFYLSVICAALRIPWNLWWKLLVAEQRSRAFATLKSIKALLNFAVGIAWIYLLSRERYMGQVYATLAVEGALCLLLTLWLLKYARGGHLRWKHLRYSLAFGVPLIPHALSGYVLNLFDRIIIQQLEGSESTGIYSLANDIGGLMNIVVMSMNQSWLPIFAEHRKNGDFERIRRLASTYSLYVYLLAVAMVLLSEEVILVLADEEFHGALPLIPVIVFGYAAMFLYTIYSNYSFYSNRTGYISLATFIAASTNVGLNYWAIPIWGYQAAAWTTLASFFMQFLVHFAVVKLVLKEAVVPLRDLLPAYFASAGLCVVYWVSRALIGDYVITLLAVKLPLVALVAALILRAHKRRKAL